MKNSRQNGPKSLNQSLVGSTEQSTLVQPQRFLIQEDQADRRIDNFLLSQLKDIPKSLLYRYLRQGRVRVRKKRVKPSYRLQENDEIVIYALKPPSHSSLPLPTPSVGSIEKLSQHILYEDDDLLVLNKPVGMAVHGGSDIPLGVIEILRYARGDRAFLELAHRLDRETSGCLIIAKKRSILRELHELFREGGVSKIYYAVTLGQWPKAHNRVSVNLQKNVNTSGERKVKVSELGKESMTDFHVLNKFALASFVEVTLYTGRTHQIRVHAQHVGHPLAGDEKYGDKAFNQMMKKLGLRRLFLHAAKIRFQLPSQGKEVSVESPLDDELKDFLQKLSS